MEDRPVLVIGYGNSLRRDDGAGLILAGSLVTTWQADGLPVTLIADHQLNPELADDIAGGDAAVVLFVDATDARAVSNAQIVMAPIASADGHGASPSVGHHLTPAAVMLYARELFGYDGEGWLITVPGHDFDHGEGLSERTQRLVKAFLGRSTDIWRSLQSSGSE